MPASLMLPVMVLPLLTLGVGAVAICHRVREIRRRQIPLPSLARARDVALAFDDTQAMDNFNNLLQLPVLFYGVCLLLLQQGEGGLIVVVGAWAYVLLRVLHSGIQLTSNRVSQRFYVWLASNLVLLALWLTAAFYHFFVWN